MDNRVNLLESMMGKTEAVIRSTDPTSHGDPTPCADYSVGELLEHIAVWVQVFDAAVNDTTVDFDPMSHRVTAGWGDVFAASAKSIVAGLRERGFDREMSMTGPKMPGEFVLNMLLMEYVGHGWDLTRATGRPAPFDDAEALGAFAAAEAIVEPQYRGGEGMFGEIVEVGPDAPPLDRFVAFLGRRPDWAPSA